MKKPSIPRVPLPADDRARFDGALKETIEIITGRRGERIEPLPAGASNDQIVAKINEILTRLQ